MLRNTAAVLAALCLAASQHTLCAVQGSAVRLRWADAAQMIQGQQVAVTTRDGATVKDRVRAVDAGAIVLEKGKVPRIDRSNVVEIRMTRYLGSGRHIGKVLGGVVGLTAGLIGAAAIGLREGSARRTSDKALAGAMGIGGLPAGLLGGYYLGRAADKEVTLIRIIPE